MDEQRMQQIRNDLDDIRREIATAPAQFDSDAYDVIAASDTLSHRLRREHNGTLSEHREVEMREALVELLSALDEREKGRK